MLGHVMAVLLANAVTLSNTDETLELTTSSAVSLDYVISYIDRKGSLNTPGGAAGNVTSATTTAVVAAPAASTRRTVTSIRLVSAGVGAQTVQIKFDKAGTEQRLTPAISLATGEALEISDDGRLAVFMSNGTQRLTFDRHGYGGRTYSFSKAATAVDTVGYAYAYAKDNGTPGAYSLGTPGLNGVVTAYDVVGTAGSGGALSVGTWVLPDPSAGGYYLTKFGLNSAVVGGFDLIDVLWYNTGLVVTTTTAQSITTPTLPARDLNGATLGEGVQVALLTTTANTNAAAIATTTVSYTNSSGTAGRTARFTALAGMRAPVSPVIGTWMPLQLQAGDTGVRSVESVTLGTSYAAGALSLVLFRQLDSTGVPLANGPSGSLISQQGPGAQNPGTRVYNDTCFWVVTEGMPAVTAPTIMGGTIQVIEQ